MQPWMQQAHALEQKFGIPHGLYVALIRQESGGNPNARSPVGAMGYAQLMPATAKGLGVNPADPQQNLLGGAMYFSQQLKKFNNNHAYALAAYNAGPGAVQKYGGIPPYRETQNYVKKVTGYWNEAKGAPRPQAGMPTTPGVVTPRRPVYGPQTAAPDAVALSNQINRIQNAYMDAPDAAVPHVDSLKDRFSAAMNAHQTSKQPIGFTGGQSTGGITSSSPIESVGATGWFKTPNGLVRNRLAGELPYQFLLRLGGKGFGLKNDAGNSQTTGGSHAAGSLHYDNRAVDWGDAKNGKQKLQQFYDWALPRKSIIGLEELIWQAPGHYNHLHAGATAGPPPVIKPSNGRRRPVKSKRQ